MPLYSRQFPPRWTIISVKTYIYVEYISGYQFAQWSVYPSQKIEHVHLTIIAEISS